MEMLFRTTAYIFYCVLIFNYQMHVIHSCLPLISIKKISDDKLLTIALRAVVSTVVDPKNWTVNKVLSGVVMQPSCLRVDYNIQNQEYVC
jgi:hypothetical protein